MCSLEAAKAARVGFPPRSEDAGIPALPLTSFEEIARWLSANVEIPRNDDDAGNIVLHSSLTNREIWQLQGADVEDLTRMYGEKDAERKPHRLHHWVGNPKKQGFWERNAIAILADPHVEQIKHNWSGAQFTFRGSTQSDRTLYR